MIISHKHQFIFLKSRKTAGSSIEIALARHCGPMDMVTQLERDEEAQKFAVSSPTTQNHFLTKPKGKPPAPADLNSYYRSRLSKSHQFHPHEHAGVAKTWVGAKTWDRYFKFSVERNPWDRMVSLYFWRRSFYRDFKLTFDEFLASDDRLDNWPIYAIEDKVVADKVVRFEYLIEDLKAIAPALGFDICESLPRAKSSTGRPKNHYRDHYNTEQRKLVERKLERTIDHFKYVF